MVDLPSHTNTEYMMETLTGSQIDMFRAKVLLGAAKIYLKSGMQVNRAYTPKALRIAISEITGSAYPCNKKGLQMAHDELKVLLDRITELLKA